MSDPTVCICVQDDVMQSIKWILKDFNKDYKITTFRSTVNFENEYSPDAWDLLILDSTLSHDSITAYLEGIKDKKPGLKTILIVPPIENKEEIIAIIKEKLVQGLVIKPFTAEVLCKYLDKNPGSGP
ncbi:MAG: hypothetical protein HZB31_05060 [Nitrospirae bacterium]|nr:hypothetical protein [Nitrospirota bacterium]